MPLAARSCEALELVSRVRPRMHHSESLRKTFATEPPCDSQPESPNVRMTRTGVFKKFSDQPKYSAADSLYFSVAWVNSVPDCQ